MHRIYWPLGAYLVSLVVALGLPAALVRADDTTELDLQNTAAMPYTQYSFAYTAQYAQTFLTFEFRQDPAFWRLDDVSFTATSAPGTQLVLNGGFENGTNSGDGSPTSWSFIAGRQGGDVATGCQHSGTHCYDDGTIGYLDAMYQSVATTVGQTYTLSFWLSGDPADGGTTQALVQVGGPLQGEISPATNITVNGSPHLAANLGTSLNPVFDGGTLQLDGSGPNFTQNFTVNATNGSIDGAGLSSTLSGVLSGPGGLVFTNTAAGGSIALTGVNTYVGSTTIDGGTTLALQATGSIATSSGVVDNGILDISGAAAGAAIQDLSGSGLVALGAQTLTLTNASSTFSGALYGSGGLTISAGTETLSGANAYTGATYIAGGATLALTGSGTIAASGSLVDNGTLNLAGSAYGAAVNGFAGSGSVILGNNSLIVASGAATFSGSISGNGSIAITGGSETLTGVNTYLGGTTITSGATLALAGNGSIASSAGVVDNGTFDISATTSGASITTLTGSGVTVLGSQTLTLTAAGTGFAGTISGAGSLIVSGGNQTLSGINSYTGATRIASAAALSLAGAGSIATSSNVLDNGLLDLSTATSGAALRALSGTGMVALGAGTLTLTQAAGVFGGTLSGTGNLVVAGGTETLSGVSSFSGSTTIGTGATLGLSGGGNLASSSHVSVDGNLDLTNLTGSTALQRLSGTGNVLLGANSLLLTAAADTFGGLISGSGGISIGAGSETFTALSTYTGSTGIAAGAILSLAGNASIAASAGVVDSGVLDVSSSTADVSLQSLAGGGSVTLGARSLTLSNAADSFAGSIAGSGGLTVAAGRETLSGSNTYSGVTTIAGGATLALTSGNAITSSSAIVDGGVLDVSGSTTNVSLQSLSGSGSVALGARSLTLTNADGTFSGIIGGAGGLVLSGGTETLTGSNSYLGGTTVMPGARLIVNGATALGNAGGGLVLDAATLETTATTTSSRNISLLGDDALVTDGNAVLTQSGSLSGNGHLTKTGSGTLDLTGDNRNWGSTSDATLGGLTVAGGLLEVGNPYALGYGKLIVDGGALATTVDILTGQSIQLSGSVSLDVDANTTTTLTGTLQASGNAGCVQKSGAGTLNIEGTATLNDGACVDAGRLSANGVLLGSLSVAPGALLRGTGTITGPVTVSGTLAPGNSPGTLTVMGTVTMAAGSTYQEDINGTATGTGPGNYSRLLIGGGGQFIASGATLTANLTQITGSATYVPYVPQIGDRFRIVSAAGGIVGRFADFAQPDGLAAGTRMSVLYDVGGDDSIDLSVVPSSYSTYLQQQGLNRNAQQAGAALDRLVDADLQGMATTAQSDLLSAVAALNAQQLRRDATALAGEVHGELAAAAPLAGEWLQGAVLRQLQAGGPVQPGDAVWFDTGANHANWSSDALASGFTTNRWQLATGFDIYAAGAARVGIGYTHSQADVSNPLASGDIEQDLGFLYAQSAVSLLFVDALAAYGGSTWDTHRADPIGTVGTLSSHAGGKTTLASLGTRLPFNMQSFTLEPYLRVLWEKTTRAAFAENASVDSLDAPGYSSSGARLSAGLGGGSTSQGALSAPFTYHFDLGVARDSSGISRPTTAAFLAGEPTSIYSPNIGHYVAVGNLGATTRVLTRGYVYLNASAESRSGVSVDFGGDLGIRWAF